MSVVEAWLPHAHPPPPRFWILLFHALGVGSHTSIPMPGEVEGAPDPSWNPGPTTILTKHKSAAAVGGVGVAGVPDNARESPCLNAWTSTTLVLESGLKAVFIESSHFKFEPLQP